MRYYLSTMADITCEAGSNRIIFKNDTAELARKHGLGLELAEFCLSDSYDENYENVLKAAKKRSEGTGDIIIHGPFNELYPCAIDKKAKELAQMRYLKACEAAARLGAHKLVIHAGFLPLVYFPDWFTEQSIVFWRIFLKSVPDDLTICLENVMEPSPEYLLRIVKGVGSGKLAVCLDTGHANLSEAAPADWLKELAPYISHLHIHNNSGIKTAVSTGDTHSALQDGSIKMEAFLAECERLCPNATAAIETADTEKSVLWLKEKGFVND